MSGYWKASVLVILATAVMIVLAMKNRGPDVCSISNPDIPGRGCSAAAAPTEEKFLSAEPNDVTTDKIAVKQAEPVIKFLELGSVSCVPCKMMEPVLEELKEQYKGQVVVEFVDIVENPMVCNAFRVRVMPTQVIMGADGQELFRHEGFFPKNEIVRKLTELGVNPERTQQ